MTQGNISVLQLVYLDEMRKLQILLLKVSSVLIVLFTDTAAILN